jgi:tripartite-type tricarboxylate transporter receptor subunit TctC
VGYGVGGPSDTIARIIAERMKPALGQPIVVENITGAAGSIGMGRLARAMSDGYTIGLGD